MFEINPANCPGETVLGRAIRLARKPIFTVSEQFALDLTSEVIQSRIMAPHLVNLLADNVLGINNGVFTEASVPEESVRQALEDGSRALVAFKDRRRAVALEALDAVKSPDSSPIWGNPERFVRDDAPWFLMAGRDDGRQKGYDVLAGAADRFLESGGKARFLFFPIPGEEGLDGLGFLRQLASKYPQSVLVLPFLFKAGYLSAIQGASFGVMPSLYEPFGMANEFYLNGAVGIGRATGGLLHQIVPYRGVPSFTEAVQRRAERWSTEDSPATGLLFREEDGIPSEILDWEAINTGDLDTGAGGPDRLEYRLKLPLFRSMVAALHACLVDAAALYTRKPDLYYKFLAQGYLHVQGNFTWEKTSLAYLNQLAAE
jgi:glycosyltransferase involved in cell wall biosynthesis